MITIAKNDGSIIINTKINAEGFSIGASEIASQFRKLGNIVGKLGAAIGIAFSVQQLVEFGAEASKTAMTMENALQGLQSIVEGQGRSFSEAQKFIEEYTKDGLIPATNAITAYKNLAQRGYDDTQIQQTMIALKDASAFGRQASMTMGEAVQSATEGLKNENSILVDNAGVTKNVAKMWDEYAASIGTTSNNLTQQQKIQAEVNGILAESKYQTGDAAKVAGTLSGKLQQLSSNFNNLKVAVGNIVNPIINSVIPAINALISSLTALATSAATVVSLVFGKVSTSAADTAETMNSTANSYNSAADAATEYGEATAEAAEEAKKSLAGFDEINRLQDQSATGGTGTAGSEGTVSVGSISVDAEIKDTVSPKIQEIVDRIKELVEPLKNIDLGPAADAFERLKEALKPLTQDIFDGLAWAWENIFVSLAKWTIEDLLPAFLDLLSGALELLGGVVDAVKPLLQWLWEDFLKPIAEWTGGVIVSVIEGLADALEKISDWIKENQTLINTIIILAGTVVGAIALVKAALTQGPPKANLFSTILSTIANVSMYISGTVIPYITGTLIPAISGALASIAGALGVSVGWVVAIGVAVGAAVAAIIIYWDEIVEAVQNAWESVKEIWGVVSDWFNKNVAEPVAEFFGDMWESISEWASEAWEDIKDFFDPAIDWFSKLLDSVKKTFEDAFYNVGVIASGCWEIIKKAWDIAADWFNENVVIPVSDFFYGMWEDLKNAATNAWEDLKAGAADAWSGVKDVFSKVSDFFEETFKKAWKKVVDVFSPAGEIFVNIKDGILKAFKEIVNGLIRGINDVVAIPFKGINAALQKIKDINILGLTPFADLRLINVPQIPYLAQGAVIPPNAPFMAVLGDQRNGTNIEAPADLIRQIVREELGNGASNDKTAELLRELIGVVQNISVGDETIGRAAARYNRRASRAGGY